MRPILMALVSLLPCARAFADSSVRAPVKTAGRAEAGCERLPTAWKLDAMNQAAAPHSGSKTPQVARILTWKIEEDDRPLRLETVLMWIQVEQHWTLAHLYRHPQDGPTAGWHISSVTDVPYRGTDAYDHAPTRADLEQFLKDTWWHFAPRDSFKILDSEVCRDAWRASFAAAPWHTYSAK
jgi:hypothetical protein